MSFYGVEVGWLAAHVFCLAFHLVAFFLSHDSLFVYVVAKYKLIGEAVIAAFAFVCVASVSSCVVAVAWWV